ncbi:MAG: hypothetical protein A2X84_09845 [Desulfuromonadaceae bacterium GWC2_58_13]|nr:MAG: hypothetical protein A2X84_09845 [Desulfuromonadaceae bacterium GWC2_58_13]
MSYYDWAPYVSVAERRAKAQKQLEKMKKKGMDLQPVHLSGRKIAGSFWGKGWCDHMESFSDYANRLPRGRSYVRNGSVCHLEIAGGRIKALVSGTTLYNVTISIDPLKKSKWETVKRACSGKIASLIDLLRGKLDQSVMEIVSDRKDGLFPLPGEMKFDCDCPDWAGMCKHVAAVLYGVGARLDQSPEMLFVLRGVNHEELVDVSAAVADATKSGSSRRRIAATGIADVFGIELADEGVADDPFPVAPSRKSKPEKPPKAAVQASAPKTASGKTAWLEKVLKQRPGKKEPVQAPSFPEPFTGAAVYAWRRALGESQVEFAARLRMSAASVSQWENKGDNPIHMQSRTRVLLHKAWKATHKK